MPHYSARGPAALAKAAAREGLRALRDPYLRGDSVALVGEATGEAALRRMRDAMRRSDAGARLLRERPLMRRAKVDFEALRGLPPGSLGGAYARYLDMHGFDFGARPRVRLIADEELAFVMQRYRDTHDLLHVLCGAPVSVTGEVALKWFEMVQTGLPMTALAAFFGGLRADDPVLPTYVNWAARAARQSALFLCVPFEQRWEAPLPELRREMGLPRLPRELPSLDAAWDETRVELLREHYLRALERLQGPADKDRRAPFERYLSALQAGAASNGG